jgi:hypothetical protein
VVEFVHYTFFPYFKVSTLRASDTGCSRFVQNRNISSEAKMKPFDVSRFARSQGNNAERRYWTCLIIRINSYGIGILCVPIYRQ